MPREPRPPTYRCPRAVGTPDNPILVNENGRVVFSLKALGSRNNLTQRIALSHCSALRPIHRQPATPPVQPAIIPVRRGPRRSRDGSRAKRDSPLVDKDLYIDDVRPPVLTTDRTHHKCPVCFNVKSHPVIYACGHGSCYVCARKWLEYQWSCPTCRALVTAPPSRNYDAEAAISYDHPEWDDRSLVIFTWDGLKFPKVPIAPDTPSP
ncbi:hypothetical protein B0H11DRAFT_2255624 [Mycena galericulata]|nr:hypothetical protein B0H11DRAFT_2255624 [Mycena galericulata]